MKYKRGARVKEEKSSEVAKLKKRIRSLQEDNKELVMKNKRLTGELATLEAQFDETKELLKELHSEVSLEEALQRGKKLAQKKKLDKRKRAAKERCPECGGHEVKLIPSRAGTILVCGSEGCDYRGVKKG